MKKRIIFIFCISSLLLILISCKNGVLPSPPLHSNPLDPGFVLSEDIIFIAEAGSEQTKTIAEDISFTISGSAAMDPEGRLFDYSWEITEGKNGSFDGGSTGSTVTFIPGEGKPEDYLINLKVTTSSSLTAEDTVRLRVVNRIFYVADSADGAADGSSWNDAFTSIEDGINAAGAFPGDALWVKAGTYLPTVEKEGVGSRFRAFRMKNNVELYGGFNGTETGLSERDYQSNLSILSGDLNGDDSVDGAGTQLNRSDNCCNIFLNNYDGAAVELNNSAVLDGFTVKGGNADEGAPHNAGGCMYNRYASPIIRNCILTDSSGEFGGALHYYNGADGGEIENCTISNNLVSNSGGGIYLDSFSLTIEKCIFVNNEALKYGGGIGGAGMNLELSDCTFDSNSAGGDAASGYGGGAIFNNVSPSVMKIDSTIFKDNSSVYRGGALVYIDGPEVTITNSLFENNTTERNGGAVYAGGNGAGWMKIYNSTFSGNEAVISADGSGGALVLADIPQTDLRNCTFYNNSADKSAGAIDTYSSDTYLTNCTFINNTTTGADNFAGSLWQHDAAGATVTNCLFYGNSADTIDDMLVGLACTINSNYCVLSGTSGTTGGTMNIQNAINGSTFNPLIGTLADNGGPVPTISIGSGSSAQNAGTVNLPLTMSITTDARGYSRDSQPDIGAFEIQ